MFDNKANPRLTVLMSVYNSDKFLGRAVESILNQTYKDFEFIIINDGSTDNSSRILKEYEQTDKRIRVYDQQNKGLIDSLNRGCRLARGEYIARMDADDISLPERLEKQIDFLKRHVEIGILGTWTEIIDTQGNHKYIKRRPVSSKLIEWSLLFKNSIAHPSVMMRRDIIEKLNYYRPQAHHIEDYDLWTRAIEVTQIANLPSILLLHRIHENSICSQQFKIQHENAINLVIRPRLKQMLGSEPDFKIISALLQKPMNIPLYQIEAIVKFILQVQSLFIKKNCSQPAHIAEISHDVGDMLYTMASAATKHSIHKGLIIYTKALQKNPLLFFSFHVFAIVAKTLAFRFRKQLIKD